MLSHSVQNTTTKSLIWFRDDLRLRDNQALSHAVKEAKNNSNPLVALYILDEESPSLRPLGSAQKYWLHHSLKGLSQDLKALNIPLVLLRGAAQNLLPKFCNQLNIKTIYWNRRYGDGTIALDKAIKAEMGQNAISVNSFSGFLLHEPWQIKTGQGMPYRVYTPFWRNFSAQFEPSLPLSVPGKLEKPAQKQVLDQNIGNTLDDWKLLPKHPNWAESWDSLWQPGELGASNRLGIFLDQAINNYHLGRDLPAEDLTSKLSPHLRFGEISPNQIYYALKFHEESIDPQSYQTYQKELVWREFAYHLSYHWPNLHQKNYNKKFDAFPWEENPKHLKCWQEGKTGYPIVDAGMRQLWQTGWMHNRVRMVVASFLVKHLLIDWRYGERWFWDCLLDADPASNPISWQWVAGCGADAAPYFRIFNPYTQAQKFDSNAQYIKTYVPELSEMEPKEILKPAASFNSTCNYYPPIVDHDTARKRALAALKSLNNEEV